MAVYFKGTTTEEISHMIADMVPNRTIVCCQLFRDKVDKHSWVCGEAEVTREVLVPWCKLCRLPIWAGLGGTIGKLRPLLKKNLSSRFGGQSDNLWRTDKLVCSALMWQRQWIPFLWLLTASWEQENRCVGCYSFGGCLHENDQEDASLTFCTMVDLGNWVPENYRAMLNASQYLGNFV